MGCPRGTVSSRWSPIPLATDSSSRVSGEELALRLGVPPERVERLADGATIERDADGLFDLGDVHRLRLLLAFEAAGVPLDALVEASRGGTISLRYYDQLHPTPGPLSGNSYAEFRASAGPDGAHLPALFAALGVAEPDAASPMTAEDEALLTDMLASIAETGYPDLALRAIRMLGDGARRAADGALATYGEAVGRIGDSVAGLPVDDVYERVLKPWGRFARRSSSYAEWLAERHLSRAIDEYSVSETERILEEAGYVAARLESPPAVAFIDLTGFTRLTEERGDEVAAATAMRLGELTVDTVRRRGGRVVKLLGDGVLVRFDEVAAAADSTLDLLAALAPAGLPTGHAGLASGPLIVRDGDVFGRTVNLAARVADATPDGHLYVPETVASALPRDRFDLQPVQGADLQGIGSVALLDVVRAPGVGATVRTG
jgi:adenylate cyclase